MEKALGSIVTYNPNLDLLKDNLQSVVGLHCDIILIDNGSENIEAIFKLVDKVRKEYSSTITILNNSKNEGIAHALNQIMKFAYEHSYHWVLTLDQDSVVPSNIIKSNEEMMDCYGGVALIAAVIKDRNETHKNIKTTHSKYSEIEECITSASLTSVDLWKELGGFDEYMFIDYVDTEYCIRARKCGYKVLRNNEVILSHAIGEIKEVNLFGRWVSIRNHSAFRKYYQTRNWLYMNKKINGKLSISVWKRIAYAFFKVIFFEKDKRKKIISMIRGIKYGLKPIQLSHEE